MVVNLVTLPICLIKDLSGLRYFNLVGIFGVIYTAIVIAIQSPWYHEHFSQPQFGGGGFKYAEFSLHTFNCFSVAMYSYFSHTAVFDMREGLLDPSKHRVNKVFQRSVAIECFIYITIGVAGYYGNCQNTPDIIVLREKIPGTNDVLMVVAQLAFIINLMVAIPTLGNPLRGIIFSFFKVHIPEEELLLDTEGQKDSKGRRKGVCKYYVQYFLTSFVLLAITSFIAYVFPDIVSYLSIVGGTVCTLLAITYPAMCYQKLKGPYHCSAFLASMLITCIGLTASILSILEVLKVVQIPVAPIYPK